MTYDHGQQKRKRKERGTQSTNSGTVHLPPILIPAQSFHVLFLFPFPPPSRSAVRLFGEYLSFLYSMPSSSVAIDVSCSFFLGIEHESPHPGWNQAIAGYRTAYVPLTSEGLPLHVRLGGCEKQDIIKLSSACNSNLTPGFPSKILAKLRPLFQKLIKDHVKRYN